MERLLPFACDGDGVDWAGATLGAATDLALDSAAAWSTLATGAVTGTVAGAGAVTGVALVTGRATACLAVGVDSGDGGAEARVWDIASVVGASFDVAKDAGISATCFCSPGFSDAG